MTLPAIIQNLKNALTAALALLFGGVNEIMFVLGFIMLYLGISDLWSRDGALVVCGSILVIVSVLGVAVSNRKGADT